ncbi:unnamed protein product [Cuscuta campestris]|uniref:Uncharacterized protein n=1 Tax=Cuscuta campestris TaxID=132261 RepID=A0A484LIF1_9ASTE|nr:unnamed protein product [Cuscuta campestris]
MYDPEREIADPRSRDILTLQATHRSREVWHNPDFIDNKVSPVCYEASLPTIFHDDRVYEMLHRYEDPLNAWKKEKYKSNGFDIKYIEQRDRFDTTLTLWRNVSMI